MALSNPLRAISQKLVTQFGQPATLRRIVTVPDPANDRVTPTTTNYPVNVVLTDYTAGEIRGLIKEKDKKGLIPAAQLPAGIEPEGSADNSSDGWFLLAESQTYRVAFARRISADTQGVVWELTVRR